ncbi:hypothetical protein PAAG_05668 [Paracoccidioides lutzii Pb01]|uniref:Uncharacterized protein n=1 Tax=Paracoccidioides lutzii (strain ATCC MYA-826 / Pb01) TaxID=502779 RepID=C1H4H5_PARBA|nr:hypothetical protein PAAG_05668 [Paracoccidioides lutzii Pb01]EEH34619.2 hypothetical protein PAAG_05668 [Paracoccidioides lutzii Pb01]
MEDRQTDIPHETTRWFPRAPLEHSTAAWQRSRACSAGTTQQRLQWDDKPKVRSSLWPLGDLIKIPHGFSAALSQLLARPQPWRLGLYVLRHLPAHSFPAPHPPLGLSLRSQEAKSQKESNLNRLELCQKNPFSPVWTPFHQAASSDWAQILQMVLTPRVPSR